MSTKRMTRQSIFTFPSNSFCLDLYFLMFRADEIFGCRSNHHFSSFEFRKIEAELNVMFGLIVDVLCLILICTMISGLRGRAGTSIVLFGVIFLTGTIISGLLVAAGAINQTTAARMETIS